MLFPIASFECVVTSTRPEDVKVNPMLWTCREDETCAGAVLCMVESSCLRTDSMWALLGATLGCPLKASGFDEAQFLLSFSKAGQMRVQFRHYLACGINKSIESVLSFLKQVHVASPRES